MIDDDLRAAFARHEALAPPAAPVRAAIDRLAATRRRRRQRLRATGVALALVGALGIGIPRLAPDPVATDATLLPATAAPAPAGPLNILLLGVDAEPTQRPPRADSVLLVHIPADRSRPYLVSLPRDLRVAIPGHGADKLNVAFAHGAQGAGPDLADGYELTRRTVAGLTGVRVDAGAVLTYRTLRALTDEVGGVEVCLASPVRSAHTARVFPAGCQRLDGTASVDLLRQRRGLPEGGLDRDRNAQIFAAALIRRAAERDVLTDPAKLFALVAAAGADLVAGTDGTPLVDLVKVLPQLKSAEPVGLSFPVDDPERAIRYVEPDPEAAPEFLAALRADRLAQWAARHPDRINRIR
ncbi:LCP family protein [Micromonospora deserti]|uniref:LytR family transcriptional regulator n=1 Tax=Micromonospora deserti TaxID=2070366 RepID=A0A2W2BZZ2_9ACTN|nr:LCP family protein [Micromonospora deserti]PZF91210.1 LytR family transcriptional regulator [Micromonospora deserti]